MTDTTEVLEDLDNQIFLNFLRPDFFTNLDTRNVVIEIDDEVPDDLLECMDLSQWLIHKGLFDKSFEYDEEEEEEYLSVRLSLDEFLITRFFDNSDEDYLNQILELFASILEDAGWDEVSYHFKLLSEEDETTHAELMSLNGEDPVINIEIELRLYDPEINLSPEPIKKNLND